MNNININTVVIKDNGKRELPFDKKRLEKFIKNIASGIKLNIEKYTEKAIRFINSKEKINAEDITLYLIRESEANLSEVSPEWDLLSRNIYLKSLYKKASKSRFYNEEDLYGSYIGLLESLGERGIYSGDILKKYSRKEIQEAEKIINPEMDKLFTYNGLYLLATRYLASDNKQIFELPQERWLTIAMFLMQDEDKINRMNYVKDAYWALSNLYMTVATPTLANAGKSLGQLSSCFIDTIDDSLQGIYDSNTDIARVSKYGGGVGAYIGKVRSSNSSIRGVHGASGGIVPWIKQLNNTAVSVDQLGQRKGAITVYTDIFHKDIEAFLDLRLNNGDQRLRAHDIFTGVCIPDLFMEAVNKRSEWYLFDPHEVFLKKGWYLQDFYDEQKGNGTFREKYNELVSDENISMKVVKAIDIFKRIMISQLETGTPFMFYRDTVNRYNPNSHAGMIYCSNLCTEILQNMSPTMLIEEVINGDEIITKKKSGDFVVCNLSSINLGKAIIDDDKNGNILDRLISIEVRMLDNVIDLNNLPVPQATITNHKYRSIGLGTFGWHHLLALKGIKWDSSEAISYCDKIYEKINYLAIKASNKLSKEKGSYSLFKGSQWETGEYFNKRKYVSQEWESLKDSVCKYGLRNAYLMAVAPNMSTAQIAGSTASIDPVFKYFYYEEKKDYRKPVIAPDLNLDTIDFYDQGAYQLDQFSSIRQNAARQIHIDQAISFNLYVPSTIKAKKLLELHMLSWELGVKTTYYVRSNDIDIEECEWCSS